MRGFQNHVIQRQTITALLWKIKRTRNALLIACEVEIYRLPTIPEVNSTDPIAIERLLRRTRQHAKAKTKQHEYADHCQSLHFINLLPAELHYTQAPNAGLQLRRAISINAGLKKST
jgi:hypothetical protein